MQGFLSVDPLTASYPHLTPYQFASNRPIDGIDLDGLEFLDYREARFEFRNGEGYIKVSNSNNVLANTISNSVGVIRERFDGTIIYEGESSGFLGNMVWADVRNLSKQANPAKGPSLSYYVPKAPGGNSKGRGQYKAYYERMGLKVGSKNTVASESKGHKGLGALVLVTEATDTYQNYNLYGGAALARNQFLDVGQKAIDAFTKSFLNGLAIPEHLNTLGGGSLI